MGLGAAYLLQPHACFLQLQSSVMDDLRVRLANLGVEVQQQQQQYNQTHGLSPASPRAYRVR